ncbi:hypothetical protein BV739P1_00008 [Phocaeicola phage BV739P1]|nr:hypothetical protein BV739P1_00008 [Phocaeicola phage BV739P1]
MLTYETAMEFFRYEPSSGKLFWKKKTAQRIKVGDEAGTFCKSTGYRMVFINQKGYLVHRIAILLTTGACDPSKEVDHIDHNRVNNRLNNLRIVDRINNMRNIGLGKTNKTGVIGVSLKYTRVGELRYSANIMVNRKSINLGIFDNIEEAAAAREDANIKYGFHPNHGS